MARLLVTAMTKRDCMQRTNAKSGSFAKRIYIPRVIGSAIGFWAIAAALAPLQRPDWLWALLIFNGYVWPHVAFLLARRVPVPYRMELRNLAVDSLLGGLWVACMQLNVLPCATLIAMYAMNSIAVGGPKMLRWSLLAQAVGGLIGVALFRPTFLPSTSQLQIYACLPMLTLYPAVVGGAAFLLAAKLAEHKRALRDFSRLDSLTGLMNQGAWRATLENEFLRCQAAGRTATLALIDIDHFKAINDTHGHLVGDEVIRMFSQTFKDNIRSTDLAGRVGGDEFSVILTGTLPVQAWEVMNRLQQRLSQANGLGSELPPVHLSIGLAAFEQSLGNAEAWLRKADQALYSAKRQGRNQIATS